MCDTRTNAISSVLCFFRLLLTLPVHRRFMKSEKDQRDEAAAKRFITDLEASISKLSIVPDSSPLTAKLVLIFWALSL